MNLINHGTINVTINNNYSGGESNDLIDFPHFDIFEDDEINKLVFNSLNGSLPLLFGFAYAQFASLTFY